MPSLFMQVSWVDAMQRDQEEEIHYVHTASKGL